SKDVAEFYRKNLTASYPRFGTGGRTLEGGIANATTTPERRAEILLAPTTSKSEAIKSIEKNKDYLGDEAYALAKRWVETDYITYPEKQGSLYQVELAPAEEEYLLWDKPLSEQSEKVKAALEKAGDALYAEGLLQEYLEQKNVDWEELTGAELYKQILDRAHMDGALGLFEIDSQSDKASSTYLHSLGIRGIKYLDGNSRMAVHRISDTAYDVVDQKNNIVARDLKTRAEATKYIDDRGDFNYVIFSDKDVSITQKFSTANTKTEAIYDPRTNSVYLIADNIATPERAVWVAIHETSHAGLRMIDRTVAESLDKLAKNSSVSKLAAAIAADRKWMYGKEGMPQAESVEEAFAELSSAIETDNLDALLNRYGVKMPQAFRNNLIGAVNRVIEAIRNFIAKVMGRPVAEVTDAEVRGLIAEARGAIEGKGTASQFEPAGAAMASTSTKQTDTAAFKAWFGKSVVTEDGKAGGKPLVVYHGTSSDVTEFSDDFAKGERALFFTDDRSEAGSFSGRAARGRGGDNVMPVYLSLKNPLVVDMTGRKDVSFDRLIAQARRGGHDGIIANNANDTAYPQPFAFNDVYIAFEPTQIKSAIGNRGTFDPNNPNILFSKSSIIGDTGREQPPRQGNIPLTGGEIGNNASWDAPEPTMLDNVIYKLQNKHIDLLRITEAIKSTGTALAEKYNAYLQEELFHGRAAKRVADFVNTELKPIMFDMRQNFLTIDELDQYLHARHAKEANALIAERDPNMPDGGSGMTDKEAQDYFAKLDPAKRKRLESVAKRVDSIIAKTRDLYVSYGLVSKDTADGWAQMFKHYVPLMREDHDGGMGIGQGFSIKGKEVKHRTGSTKSVVDIFANIALQREKVVVRGEKNRVATALAGLAKLNPNPDFWTFGKAPIERVLNEKTGLVEERVDPMFKSRANVVIAKIKDGSGNVHERAIVFNESNERAVRMAEAIKNLDASQLDGLLGVSAKVTRYCASINTQYNPVFGITNLIRDVQGAALNLTSTPLAKHKAEVIGHILSAAKG
ncbi:MAG: hypothetical protein WAW75_07670, partial [Gallionella sp.]